MKKLPITVYISEGANLMGLSMKTVRQGVKHMEIKHFLSKNRYQIKLTNLIIWSHLSARRRNRFYKYGLGQYSKQWVINNNLYTPLGKHNINK